MNQKSLHQRIFSFALCLTLLLTLVLIIPPMEVSAVVNGSDETMTADSYSRVLTAANTNITKLTITKEGGGALQNSYKIVNPANAGYLADINVAGEEIENIVLTATYSSDTPTMAFTDGQGLTNISGTGTSTLTLKVDPSGLAATGKSAWQITASNNKTDTKIRFESTSNVYFKSVAANGTVKFNDPVSKLTTLNLPASDDAWKTLNPTDVTAVTGTYYSLNRIGNTGSTQYDPRILIAVAPDVGYKAVVKVNGSEVTLLDGTDYQYILLGTLDGSTTINSEYFEIEVDFAAKEVNYTAVSPLEVASGAKLAANTKVGEFAFTNGVGSVTWALTTAASGGADNGKFTLNNNELKVAANDTVGAGTYNVQVTATDDDATVVKNVVVTVTTASSGNVGGSVSTPSGNVSNTTTTETTSGTDTPKTDTVEINGVDISSVSGSTSTEGELKLTPTEEQIKEIIKSITEGNLTLNTGSLPSGVNSVSFSFNPSSFPSTMQSFTISTPGIGTFEIKFETLSQFEGKVTIVIKSGSIIVDILVDGKSVAFTDYSNPMTISMPYKLKDGELAKNIVMINKATGKTIPRSYYKDGYVYAVVYSSGHFDVANIPSKSFTDTAGTWSDEAVRYMNTHGVINGITDTTFSPDAKITREQYITMLIRLLNLTDVDYSKTEAFADVSKDNYYYSVVMQAKTLGITNGVGNNNFGLGQTITVEDMYTMTYRAMQQFGMAKDFDSKKGLDAYSDGDKVSSYAVEAMQNLLQNGIVKSEGKLSPKAIATRATTALFMYRLLLSDK